MGKFWLIQRGSFGKSAFSEEQGKHLLNPDGLLILENMGSAEFQFAALPKAFRRLLYHFSEYEIFGTGICTPEKDELMVFCKKSVSTEIISGIRQLIENSYTLKEYSELEKVPTAKKGDTSFDGRRSNFWWCIDINTNGDWMAFLQPQADIFKEAIESDYQNWWLTMSPEEREKEYNRSRHW